MRPLIAALLAMAALTVPQSSHAEPLGQKGNLIIDQISGFRVSSNGELHYYGPLGFSTRSTTEHSPFVTQNDRTTRTYTTFWIAPSADFLVIDHLSLGGLIEFSTTGGSDEYVEGAVTTKIDRPRYDDFTLLPRIGWLIDVSDRFGIWPRGGIGYVSRGRTDLAGNRQYQTTTYSGFLFDFDVGFLLKVADSLFLRAAPELSYSPGSISVSNRGVTQTADASAFQFAVTAGIGGVIHL